MPMTFKSSDITKLEGVLGVEGKSTGSSYRFELKGNAPGRQLTLEIYPGIAIGNEVGNLVCVYTQSAHLQLHFCSGFVVSEMLGEVTFIGEDKGKISGLIIEKEGGCSLYANVDRTLLSGDFTRLGPEVMLSGIALSLTDGMLQEHTKKARSGVRKTVRKKASGSRA